MKEKERIKKRVIGEGVNKERNRRNGMHGKKRGATNRALTRP